MGDGFIIYCTKNNVVNHPTIHVSYLHYVHLQSCICAFVSSNSFSQNFSVINIPQQKSWQYTGRNIQTTLLFLSVPTIQI